MLKWISEKDVSMWTGCVWLGREDIGIVVNIVLNLHVLSEEGSC